MEDLRKSYCEISREESNHSRRCFMTGEYCSRQRNIQQQRSNVIKQEGEIIAFVVMNFSDMSEVVYKWRIQSFVESLSKYFYINQKTNVLRCFANEQEIAQRKRDDDLNEDEGWKAVKSIRVIRSDTELSSNFVICNRICQQMQIADIVVVDVSAQNPNVFYELGMAVALGKFILPICYSDSYYKISIPDKMKIMYEEGKIDGIVDTHIDCYPWKRRLFEDYGIYYIKNNENIKYLEFNESVYEKYAFSDIQYKKFPYDEKIKEIDGEKIIGQVIYEKIKSTYENISSIGEKSEKDLDKVHCKNTLVLYTMEKFSNEEQAGNCIVNFYYRITKKLRDENCFCGERVGVLAQANPIPESDKDAKKQLNIYYDIGEIIQIGVNQATYQAAENKLKTQDVLSFTETAGLVENKLQENAEKCIKEFIRNRALLVYPSNPVYVTRAQSQFYGTLFEESEDFLLYDVMLRTLRYTNEIVVDISNNYNNCLQSLFWLGIAHGLDVYAITVLHEETSSEREIVIGTTEKRIRNIFDVAGLWTAILHANDTEGFYKQLSLAQEGVENHSKLVRKSGEFQEDEIRKIVLNKPKESSREIFNSMLEKKIKEDKEALESFYRKRFWDNVLKYNKLHIYLPQFNSDESDKRARTYMVKWDFEAISELSYYLSKRKTIGEYRIMSSDDANNDMKEKKQLEIINFISVGKDAKILNGEGLAYNLKNRHKIDGISVRYDSINDKKFMCSNGGRRIYRGFSNEDGTYICTQHACAKCQNCLDTISSTENDLNILDNIEEFEDRQCIIAGKDEHYEIAQLILWRDEYDDKMIYRVSLIGSSGPATLAATLLFVDKDQKQKRLQQRDLSFLYELQEDIRKCFVEKFKKDLKQWLDAKDNYFLYFELNEQDKKCRDNYINLVIVTVIEYLSTVLYRYFLPFLSEKDIKRIRNGMFMFLNHMQVAEESPFALEYKDIYNPNQAAVTKECIKDIIKFIPQLLENNIRNFIAIEMFYSVKVLHKNISKSETFDSRNMTDNRKLMSIEKIEDHPVKCYWIDDKEEDII